MNVTKTELGPLACRVLDTDPTTSPELAVVLCHGYGAPGDDLVGLGGEILRLHPELQGRVRFYFPEAPLQLGALGFFESRAWWQIDMAQLEASMASGTLRDMRNEEPEGLAGARRMFRATLEEILAQTGLPVGRILLGGFSQGAMLATDTALRLEEPPAALAIMSGTLLMEEQWRRLASRRAGLPVLQSHGRLDPLLPFVGAEWLRDMLEEAGLAVDFIPFDDVHTIPGGVLVRLGALVASLV